MVLSRILFLAFFAVTATACQRVPEWEMRADRAQKGSLLQQWPQYQRWLWTCRASVTDLRDEVFPPTGIAVSKFLGDFHSSGLTIVDALGTKRLLGTAVLWNQEGLLISLDHWTSGASDLECRNGEVDWQAASVITRDEGLNLSVIRVNPASWKKSVRFGEWPKGERPKLDDELWVLASPYPGMVERNQVFLNALKGSLQTGIDEHLLLFSPAPADEMAGGVLVNSRGEWAGYLNGKQKSVWGRALTVNFVNDMVRELLAKGEVRRLYLGMHVRWIPAVGFVVHEIAVDGAAFVSGIRLGDVILSWNGKKLTEAADWPSMKLKDLGSEVELSILRSGKEIQLKLVVKDLSK